LHDSILSSEPFSRERGTRHIKESHRTETICSRNPVASQIGESVLEEAGQLHINSSGWSSASKKVLTAFALLMPILLTSAAFRGRPSAAVSACWDLTQFFLLAIATVFFAIKGVSARSTQRAYWLLIALGFCVLSINMFLWVYYELWLRRPVPSLPIGEFLLFIKLVPILAALALQPQKEHSDRTRVLGLFDFSSLLVCWAYVYFFWAMAYLLATNDLARYNRNSDAADAVGNQVCLIILVVVAIRSRGRWRGFYLHFLGAFALYSFSSILINQAIDSGRYYTGSFYDVPLTAAMAWFCVTAINYNVDSPSGGPQSPDEPKIENRSSSISILWPARLAMLATLSTPLIGLSLVVSGEAQDPVRHFRILLTLFTMLLLTILLVFKQDLLNFRLGGYLREASEAYSDLRRFEDQLVQNEKLASLGKLVARVAHEINTAMTVVERNIEVLNSLPSGDRNRQKMTAKIEESARRTNNLVESMLSFAQEMPVHREAVNVKPLLESAMSLTRAERRHNVQVEIHETGAIPMVEADANQLVQVFLHIIANAIDAMEESQRGSLTIMLKANQESVEIEFADTGSGLRDPRRVFEPFYTTKPVGKGVGLGLSTCYGIIRQHGGEIDCRNRPEGGAVVRLLIPVAMAAALETAQ
jgi:signal transduction histidine kinase